jgi:hypothetical protein
MTNQVLDLSHNASTYANAVVALRTAGPLLSICKVCAVAVVDWARFMSVIDGSISTFSWRTTRCASSFSCPESLTAPAPEVGRGASGAVRPHRAQVAKPQVDGADGTKLMHELQATAPNSQTTTSNSTSTATRATAPAALSDNTNKTQIEDAAQGATYR